MRSNLTLILGVRYEYFSPVSEKYGRLANLAIAPGYGSVSVITGDDTIYPDRNNFSPRLAIAYKIPWPSARPCSAPDMASTTTAKRTYNSGIC